MEPGPDSAGVLRTRWSTAADAEGLAVVHAGAWRYAYAGVIPEPGLTRMIGRRGPGWWRRLHDGRGRALVAALGEDVVGYALVGRCRSGPGGEIQELYVRPECQGIGFGSQLFAAARAELDGRGVVPLTVWCLAGNLVGLAFYRALGGRETGSAVESVAGARLEKRRFTWG
ncbi:GNAT family N-acetyltransferase [Amaricoccus sp.]|uniref:GNAT family N-acetyltransferase n=1 Tax=Amaricoccus sp. TaxID=1872485 RepID=UPI001B6ECF25|nr:GNAT family N-acetyltransferase [Amaricoccus sp.]MBP7001670.1 GNAT family N-acetyltransferase [Amaricoccus sp.]